MDPADARAHGDLLAHGPDPLDAGEGIEVRYPEEHRGRDGDLPLGAVTPLKGGAELSSDLVAQRPGDQERVALREETVRRAVRMWANCSLPLPCTSRGRMG